MIRQTRKKLPVTNTLAYLYNITLQKVFQGFQGIQLKKTREKVVLLHTPDGLTLWVLLIHWVAYVKNGLNLLRNKHVKELTRTRLTRAQLQILRWLGLS